MVRDVGLGSALSEALELAVVGSDVVLVVGAGSVVLEVGLGKAVL